MIDPDPAQTGGHHQGPALLLADASGLDFLNSIATPVDEPVDWIADGEGLLRWLEQAAMVPQAALDAFRSSAEPAALDAVAAEARELREWFRGFVQARKGRPLTSADPAELDRLNVLLRQDDRFEEIVSGGGALRLRSNRRWSSPRSLLLPIAEAMAKLACEEDFTYVKACEGLRCTLMFADHTRGHARRWCSMALCGNRAKVAAHRQRLKDRERR
ncbi:CGNR zinc finger domain-containing protein [Nocardia sp. NPDC088792]|uniref:CGNR zinc finger domain-containing protein n=1 Tax=Nocardia sp. NPDC088792 TaxID=3364332 RepID=UPI0037FD54D7